MVISGRRSGLVVASALLAGLAVAACAHPLSEDADAEVLGQPIVGGTTTAADPAVFQMKAVTPLGGGSSSIGGCTATLIAPRVLATAGHCVEGSNAQTVVWVSNAAVPGSAIPSEAGGYRRVSQVLSHEKYPQPFINLGYDCAALVLEQPITGIPPKALSRSTMTTSSVGETARIVGFGHTDGASQTGGGIKRHLQTRIKEVRDGVLTIGARGAVSCQGDSGGPAFVVRGGVEVMAGISSYGDIGCVEQGSYSRTELCAPFFDAIIAANGGGATGGGTGAGTPDAGTPGGNDAGTPPPPPTGSACAESEPNDFLGSDNRLCADGTATGSLGSVADTDFFAIDIAPNTTYDVRVEGPPSVDVTLYKETSTGYYGWGSSSDGGVPRVFQQTPSGGRYYAKVHHKDGSTATGETYRLRLVLTP